MYTVFLSGQLVHVLFGYTEYPLLLNTSYHWDPLICPFHVLSTRLYKADDKVGVQIP